MRPRIGFAAWRLLEAAGCEVVVPETQTCCGQPGYNAGDLDAARSLALKLAHEFTDCEYVVVPSGSCGGMIRVHYPKLFIGDTEHDETIRRLADRTYELTDFLTRVATLDRPPAQFNGTFTYHDACSGLRELNVRDQPRALLDKMPAAKLIEMANTTTCCGFGGTFANKYGAISARMALQKCRAIRATKASTVVAGDLGCLLNIETRLRADGDTTTQVRHIAEVLAGDDDHTAG